MCIKTLKVRARWRRRTPGFAMTALDLEQKQDNTRTRVPMADCIGRPVSWTGEDEADRRGGAVLDLGGAETKKLVF